MVAPEVLRAADFASGVLFTLALLLFGLAKAMYLPTSISL
jgi:hypothetical protein